MRAGMGLGDAEVSEEQRHGFRGHGGAAVGVDGQLITRDPLPGARLADEPFGERGALPMGHHPADDVPTEDVEHDVQVEVGPLGRPEEIGDVPAPQLVRPAGEELGGNIAGMSKLVPPLPNLLVGRQEAVHRPLRAEVPPLVEEGRVDCRGGDIHEARLVEHRKHVGLFLGAERTRRGPTR
jgi:hypothetical protein